MTKNQIENIRKNLDDLEKELLKIINSQDSESISEKIIHLMSEYPEQKELLKFIIFLNDKINNAHSNTVDAMYSIVSNLISQKKELLTIIDHLEEKKANKDEIKTISLTDIPTSVWVFFSVSIISILLFVFLVIHPEKTETIVKGTTTIVKEIKNDTKN